MKKVGKFLLIIIMLIILGIIGYEAYYKFYKKDVDRPKEETKSYEKISLNELKDIVKDQLFILDDKTSINDIDNQDKLWMSFKNADGSFSNSIEASKLLDYFNNSVLSDLGIENDNINYFDSNRVLYIYDKDKDVYNIRENAMTSYNYVDRAYTSFGKMSNTEEGLYTLSVKYLWYYNEPAFGFVNVYGNYEDALNQVNKLNDSEITSFELSEEDASKYLEEDNIKNYNYTFRKTNDKISLIDFNIK